MKKKILIPIITILIILGVLGYVNKDIIVLKTKGYDFNQINFLKDTLESEKIAKVIKYDYLNNLTELLKSNEYNSEYFDYYLEKLSKNESIDKIFFYLDKDVIEFTKEKYYIDQNVDRYLNYLDNNKDLSYKEIITRVNSNLDYEFYTNTQKANYLDDKLILVNKYSYIENDYPTKLVKMEKCTKQTGAYLNSEAYENFVKMCDDAMNDKITIYNVSAYRTFSTQQMFYDKYLKRDGKERADKYSARPGYSEHQTGYATDINVASSKASFETTDEYSWLIENSYKYGFILRYPKGKEYITGYNYEPWHYRYVGLDIAKYIHDNDITYEEYYAYFIANKNVE